MGGACRTHEGDEKFVNILLETLKRRHHLEPRHKYKKVKSQTLLCP
jgi:hypothetical protein